ncbi:MAG TPA: glycoside hydrolase family 172 protein [Thermoguttaceae bacterium]|nr:glycoside hydrolase family 172 protein [Thermoguttaceae bacterium]
MRQKNRTGSLAAVFPSRRRPVVWAALAVAAWAIATCGVAGDLDDLAKPHEGRSMRSTSTAVDDSGDYAHGNSDNSRVAAGATKVVLNVEGPGVITHMWFTFLGPEPHPWAKDGSANHQEILLRIYYDGSERPGVEAPLGDFFANSFGKRSEVISVPVVVEDADSYNCFWRMPFRKSVRVEVVNQSEKKLNLLYYNIDWIKRDSLPENTPYFYAQYRQEYPVEQGKDYVILDTQGKGHYVGTVLSVRTRSPSWFGEGDEKIYLDGEKKPSIWGTGTEDYFLSAWGLKTTGTPYFGTPYFDQRGIVGGHTSAYRWHVHDPIVFNTSITVTIEHWGWISVDENPEGKSHSWNERQDDFSSVAFWYQTGTPTFTARAPDAKERTLPNLDLVFPAKPFTDEKHHGDGEARVQTNLGFFPQGQLFYRPEQAEGAWVEIPFEVKEKEPRRLLIKGTRAPDYGRYQAYLNGVKLGGPIDLYHDGVSDWEFHLLDFWPDPGPYTLRLECVGKSPKSTGHFLGIESVRLRERRPRVKEWARDKDKDWREAPILYD